KIGETRARRAAGRRDWGGGWGASRSDRRGAGARGRRSSLRAQPPLEAVARLRKHREVHVRVVQAAELAAAPRVDPRAVDGQLEPGRVVRPGIPLEAQRRDPEGVDDVLRALDELDGL